MTFDAQHQKLVDIAFQLVGIASTNPILLKKNHHERMEWVAEQLRHCGFPTKPMGASWGVLINEPTSAR